MLFILTKSVYALNPEKHVSQYGHTVWRTRDDSFDGSPIVLTQTADGYLWIGTNLGLVRFDGARFTAWNPPSGERLLDTRIFSILAARDGSLWIGTGNGVARWRNRTLSHYPQIDGRIESIVEDADGTVWVVRTQATNGTGPLCSIKGEQTQCYGRENGIPFPLALQLQAGSSGDLWIGGYDGICRWKSGSSSTYFTGGHRRPETFASLKGLATTRDGSVWAAIDRSDSGFQLQHFADGRWTARKIPGMAFNDADITTLFVDRDDVLWVGTAHHGIWRFRESEIDHFGNIDGLSSDSVGRFYQDAEGTVWAVTSEGIDNFRDIHATSFSPREGLSAAGASSVVAGRDGTVWIGNFEALDALRGNAFSAIRTGHGLPGLNVTTLFEDHAGRLWVGVDDGLWIYDGNRFRAVRRADGTALGIVFSITEDLQHTMWVRAGPNLDRIDDLNLKSEITSPRISTAYVLAANPRGGVVLGLVNGDLLKYEDGEMQTLAAGAENTRQIRDLLVESDGTVWGTTLDEVFRWKNGVRKNLTPRNGLPCDGIFALVQDHRDSLWLYSRCGLITIEKSQLAEWWDHPDHFVKSQVLDALDGVFPGLTSLKPQTAVSPDGRLWFVNGRILQMIDPRDSGGNVLPPPVHIEEIVADHKSYATQDHPRLPPLTRDLEIDYTALSFVVPQKVHFRYLLEGHDAGWQQPGSRRQAFYNDLRPGHYRFHVIACNNDGVWNEVGAFLEFSIAPAYYQTAWFRGACVGLFLTLLWALYQLRLQQLHRQFSIGLEARVNERTRIARELHDTLLQSFHGLLFRLQAARNLFARRPEEAVLALDGAIDMAAQAIAEGRDAIQGLRSASAVQKDLADLLTATGQELLGSLDARPGSPKFSVTVEGVPQTLSPVLQDEVYRIAREVIANAFRHANANQIEAEISYDDHRLRLRIRDDGKGMDPKALKEGGRPGHWGLPGIRERAKQMGARSEFWSEAGAGTEFELTVPASVAFAISPDAFGSDEQEFGAFRKKKDYEQRS
ncbi:MAG: two-component regulator propeller domain-containing protein [Candidatus Acidiferrum sp.]